MSSRPVVLGIGLNVDWFIDELWVKVEKEGYKARFVYESFAKSAVAKLAELKPVCVVTGPCRYQKHPRRAEGGRWIGFTPEALTDLCQAIRQECPKATILVAGSEVSTRVDRSLYDDTIQRSDWLVPWQLTWAIRGRRW